MTKKKTIKKTEKYRCFECLEEIDIKKDHHIQINTMNRIESPDDHTYWHFECWVKYFSDKVNQKAKENVKMMQEKAQDLFNSPMISSILSKVKGSEMLGNMLNLHLNQANTKADPVLKIQIKSKTQNDRKRKRSAKSRKK